MGKVIRKWFAHFEKEEKWLNDMAAKGLALTQYTWGRYVFEECEPEEYIYRIQLLENRLSHRESESYIEFMGEAGVEIVSSYGRWVYFRKKATDGAFDIYSDSDSIIKHYQGIITLWGILGFLNLMNGINSLHMNVTRLREGISIAYIGAVCLLLGSLMVALCIPYIIKIRKLKQEKLLHE